MDGEVFGVALVEVGVGAVYLVTLRQSGLLQLLTMLGRHWHTKAEDLVLFREGWGTGETSEALLRGLEVLELGTGIAEDKDVLTMGVVVGEGMMLWMSQL